LDGLLGHTGLAAMVAGAPAVRSFTLVDVGCSSGLDPAWRSFGAKLTAFGFDPNVQECARLQAAETLPGVRYIPAFIAAPADLPLTAARAGRGPCSRNPWDRLSVARSVAIREARAAMSGEEKSRLNLWQKTELADPAKQMILRDFLAGEGVSDVDVVKIDVDGMDFTILDSVGPQLAAWHVLAVGLEINFFGSDDPTDHSFHAMDRFMRAHGFDLFDLSVRRYSHAALPAPYMHTGPGPTRFGRPVQGDALYLRDLAAPEQAALTAALPPNKLLKFAAIASLARQPDLAAELLVRERARLEGVIDVGAALDQLAADAGGQGGYAAYMAAFEADAPEFYPARNFAAARPGLTAAPDPRTAELEREITALRHSTSWRLTAPLRAAMRLLRG
jgi:hypothetical protein